MPFKISIKKKKKKHSNKPLPQVNVSSAQASSSSSKPVSSDNFEIDDDDFVLTQERDSYEGERNWRHQKHGYGVFFYDNGDVYDGYWVDGKKHGKGIYHYVSGEKLDGYFFDDEFHEGVKITKKGKKIKYEKSPAKKLEEDDFKLDKNFLDPNSRFDGMSHKRVESMKKEETTREEMDKERDQKREEMVKKMREKYGIPEKS